MKSTSAPRSFRAAVDPGGMRRIPRPPPSGVRPIAAARPNDAIRELAREAESLDLDPLAFELFFIASRLESTDRADLARRDLEAATLDASDAEARFYRLAVRALDAGPEPSSA